MAFSLGARKNNPPAAAKANEEVLADHWYVMQAGSTAWGYFHEVILRRENRLFYRYDMVKREGQREYRENLGAVAEDDLTPVAFNLNKSGGDVQESYSGTYEGRKDIGVFSVSLKGSRVKNSKRHVRLGTILEAFFPVWLQRHWDDLKPGYRGSVPIFTEDADSGEYQVKTARLEYTGERKSPAPGCKEVKVEYDSRASAWCVDRSGALVDMVIGKNEITVRRVAGEKEAKSALTR